MSIVYSIGDSTLVNTTTEGSQVLHKIVTLPDGTFVVTWFDVAGPGSIFDPGQNPVEMQQRYSASGEKIGGEVPMQEGLGGGGIPTPSGFVLLPDNGDLTFGPGTDGFMAQAHDWHGQPLGNPVTITTGADSWVFAATLLSPSGDIALAWQPTTNGAPGEVFTTVLHLQVIHPPGQPLTPDHIFYGTGGDDTFMGTGASDGFTLRGGTNLADGGDGVDFAYYMFNHLNYTVLRDGNVLHVSGVGEFDTLVNVERVFFSDRGLAFDQHARITSEIIGAVFGAEQVHNVQFQGIGIGLLDNGMSVLELMQLAINARAGGPASNEAVVDLLYTNVVGHAPSAEESQFFTSLITSGQFTQASLGVFAAEHPLNQANIDLVGLAATGVQYA